MHRLILVFVFIAGLVMACGGTAPAASTALDGADTCANAAGLKTAVGTLDAIDLTTAGAGDLKASIDSVAAATDQLIEGADAAIAQQLEDLEGAVNVLEAAYEEASTGTIADSAVAIKAAIVDVDTGAAVVGLTLKPTCG